MTTEFKVGQLVEVRNGTYYTITVPGTIGVITCVFPYDSVDIKIIFYPPTVSIRYIGKVFTLNKMDLKIIIPGEEVKPVEKVSLVCLKIREMESRRKKHK